MISNRDMNLLLDSVSKRFGSFEALSSISLEIGPGQVLAVTGENGAGKTTLLRLLAGLLVPDLGRVFFDGALFSRKDMELRRRVYFTPDVPVLFQQDTVAANVAAIANLYGRPVQERSAEIAAFMEECGIAEAGLRKVNKLSRGQAWKAGMAAVFAVQPELWLVDEPFASGMDSAGLAAFRKLARQLVQQGSTVIFSTQLLEFAADFAGTVLVLRKRSPALHMTSTELKALLATSEDAGTKLLRGETTLNGPTT